VLFHFEQYILDVDRRELRRGVRLVSVEPKVFDLLVHVIARRERVVSKDELIAAIWNGRVVSESAMTTCINAARTVIGDSGETQRLIKTLPRKGIRFVGKVSEEGEPARLAKAEPPSTSSRPGLTLPDKPSLAVLPFTNLSADTEQEYFADGIVEEITTALSRMRWLFVISRNSSFTYKGRAVDAKRVGQELGVRYLVEGSVRKAAKRVRITAQLIDTDSGTSLSAHRFEGTLEDVFDLQDQVAASVIGAITSNLEKAEIARAKGKPTENLDAYDLYLRGMANAYRWTRDAHGEALRLFYKAIELDPDFASAYGMAARAYAWRATNGWVTDPAREVAEAARLSQRAVELGKDDAVALASAGMAVARVVGDLQYGVHLIDQALTLNPNLFSAWANSGWVRVWFGEPDVAIEHFQRAIRLSPVDPQMFVIDAGIAAAHFIAGRFDEASIWSEKALGGHTDYGPALRVATASYALAAGERQAQQVLARLQKADPDLRISNVKDRAPTDGLRTSPGSSRVCAKPD
jgi:TolB-like protein/Tfp pilus assembly protein PilF